MLRFRQSEKAKAILTEKFGITANAFDHNVMPVLALACDEGYVTNERLRYLLNMHKAEISGLLKLMVRKDLLKAHGYGRGMHYMLPAKSMKVFGAYIHSCNERTIDQNVCDDANSASSGTNSASNSASSRKKRLSKKDLKSLIISICTDWVSIEEIVERSGKSTSYIRNEVIPWLLTEESIVMMYPGTPRNPNQKYRVKE